MNKLNWGIIGTGKMARIFAKDLNSVENSNLYAVASRFKDKAVNFAKEVGATKAYSGYTEILEDKKVDVIYVATPHSTHFKLTLASLRAKKHVLCEKPMCLSAEETKILIQEAKLQGCFLMEGIWTRFMPSTEEVLQLIDDDKIGKIISVEADFGFIPAFDPNSRLFKKELGGGSLMDIGVYPLFLSLLCLGKPSIIKAKAEFTSTKVDDLCEMHLKYKDNKFANLACSFKVNSPTEAIIKGEKGFIKLHSRFHQCQLIEVFDINNVSVEKKALPYMGNGYVHEIKEVHECINRGKIESELLPHQFSLQLAELLEKVRKQIKLEYS